ncbi:MAG: CHAT domain-containing protein, partial [Bacteroidota bacterium]|nr:CHAT domain-containing protein [Bacteroidota bacterium]
FKEGILLKDQDLYQQVAYKLYKILIPVTLPKSIKSLIIIPSGELTSLPFEALLTQPGSKNLKKSNAYLLNRYNISYAYSAWLLYERLIQENENAPKHLLAMAPVFADSLEMNEAAIVHSDSSLKKFNSNNKTEPLTGNKFFHFGTSKKTFREPFFRKTKPQLSDKLERTQNSDVLYDQDVMPLIASEREVTSIAGLFQSMGADTRVLLYHQASEDQIKSPEASGYNYIHLATHGFVNEKFPELSGLLLSRDNTHQEDGVLYTGEIYNMRLKADLITLSACETGLGKLAQGEGVIGITRALLYAGAKNVIVSLWKVNDRSTADLMVFFYKELLSGKDKATALQIAKRKLIKQGRYTLPFYWAPFILIGK